MNMMERCGLVIADTYKRLPLALVRGEGCRLWDDKDRVYIDFVAGIAVCNLGHSNPVVCEAIESQMKRLIHVSNLYYTEPQVELAEILTNHSFADKVFFCNSGAEANEAAIKLVRKYSIPRYKIIVMEGSFHGRTIATLSATGQSKFQKGFEPLLPGFDFVPFDDISAIRKKIDSETCAIMVEPIQGEGGVNIPSNGYLREMRELCWENNLLLIFDEVQVGMGRTGRLFAHENYGVEPDIMTLAKALANGLPMGGMLARDEVAASFTPGTHASTFGGNPVCAAAAISCIQTLVHGDILVHCQKMGDYLVHRLMQLMQKYPFVKDVRGKGLMIGMELGFPGERVVERCIEEGVLINCTRENVLRFVPPLIITEKEIDYLTEVLNRVFSELLMGA
jgi:acetylornithine/N-succinyldiaminopimelate aminotransferase